MEYRQDSPHRENQWPSSGAIAYHGAYMAEIANLVPGYAFSWRIVLTLLAVLVLSAAMFAALVRRWTTHRHRVVLSDWAKSKGFHIGNPEQPPNLVGEFKSAPRVRTWLKDDDTLLLALETGGADPAAKPARWHALVRALPSGTQWKPSGLRPAGATDSLLDLYSLSSFPALGNTDRFVIYGTDSLSARTLSKSQARGLLPPDIGMLLVGRHLVLDFSERPFDPIEFDRILLLADQLVGHLPVPTTPT